jgi:hypothetical protein
LKFLVIALSLVSMPVQLSAGSAQKFSTGSPG